MNILQVYNLHRHGGGADTVAEDSVRLLQEAGHLVTKFVKDSASLDASLAGKVRAFSSGLYPAGTLQEFHRLLHEESPDVIHAHEVYPLISPWIFRVAAKFNIPVVLTCHDFRLTCPVATHLREGFVCTKCLSGSSFPCISNNCRGSYLESIAYASRHAVGRFFGLIEKHVDALITPSVFCQEWLISAGHNRDKVHVVPNFIDTKASTGVDVKNKAGDYIAYAGRNASEKGLSLFMHAAEMSGLPVKVACDHLNGLEAFKNNENIHFVQWLKPDELRPFLHQARFVVVPSLFFESFGLIAAEALAVSTPILVSNHGALKEMVEDGVDGKSFALGDVNDLVEKMQLLWEDPEGCLRMGLAGRTRVLSEFSPEQYTARLEKVYDHVIAGRGRG